METPFEHTDDEDLSAILCFHTEKLVSKDWEGSHKKERIEIFQGRNFSNWNLTLLTCFLNEMDIFTPAKNRPYIKSIYNIKNDSNKVESFTFTNIHAQKFKIWVDLLDDYTPRVYISAEFVKKEWTPVVTNEITHVTSCRRKNKKPKLQEMIEFRYALSYPKVSTRALLFHTPLMFHHYSLFSECLKFFADNVIEYRKFDKESSLNEFKQTFTNQKKADSMKFKDIISLLCGYLHLNVKEVKNQKKNLATIRLTTKNEEGTDIEKEYYIISGVYISPWCKSLFEDNPSLIQGFLLDTTWTMLPFYVTSIIMGCCYNTGIPLAFSFGHSENIGQYSELLSCLVNKCNITLQGKYLESDQGTALKAVCSKFKMINLACLRHLCVSLHYSPETYYIVELIKALTEEQLINIKLRMIEQYNTLFNGDEKHDNQIMNNINGSLKKVGLFFTKNDIAIIDELKWKSVSMMHRVPTRMPSTTNSLESTHGHINKITPRRNNFYGALYRIVKHIMNKSQRVQECIKINYARAKRVTLTTLKQKSEARIRDEIRFYHSSIDKCECGENHLISSIFDIDIPCSHRIFLGAKFSPLNLQHMIIIKPQWNNLEFEFSIINDESPLQDYLDDADFDKARIIAQIRRYTHYKKKEEISEFVESRYHYNGSEFINSKPACMHDIIAEGIKYFSSVKE